MKLDEKQRILVGVVIVAVLSTIGVCLHSGADALLSVMGVASIVIPTMMLTGVMVWMMRIRHPDVPVDMDTEESDDATDRDEHSLRNPPDGS